MTSSGLLYMKGVVEGDGGKGTVQVLFNYVIIIHSFLLLEVIRR